MMMGKELPGKQQEKYKQEAKALVQQGNYLEAAGKYIKLAELAENPLEKWTYQLEAACSYGNYLAPIYAERSDEIYDQMGDIQEHYNFIENSFLLAFKFAPGKKQKRETARKAKQVCKELARFYGKETEDMYCMGDNLGEEYRKDFTELGRKLAKMG
jgi:tetratricopeptide (TPR) repeat protein